MSAILSIRDLHVGYGKVEALKGISLELKKGELAVVLGSNGAGKTTLLKTISGLLRPLSGDILLNDLSIAKLAPDEIVRRGISHCPEGRRVFPRQTVYENLRLGAFTRKDKDVESDIDRMLEKFPQLAMRKNQIAGSLSGGEQQMLAISRALMARPRILLLDEPSMGLSPILVKEVGTTIADIHEDGISILLVEQNANMALELADYGHVLELGKVTLSGTAESLLENDAVREAYLGI